MDANFDAAAIAAEAAARAEQERTEAPPPWGDPDLSLLRQGRRAPSPLPLDVFGDVWAAWIARAADAAAAAPDHVVANLLAAASGIIGHARWAQAVPGWNEPPHLWCATVGDSGTNKSAAADALAAHILPALERKMMGDFPDRLAEWKAKSEAGKAKIEEWQKDVRAATKSGHAPPPPPKDAEPPEPKPPRLVMTDVTVEKVAMTLAEAAPKGVIISRDELSGWLLGLNVYNDAGRQFWLEAHGGRPYRVDRQKLSAPVIVPRLAVSVMGSTQPEKVAEMFRGPDDGLLPRFCWFWPDQKPFKLARTAPGIDWAINALDRLRELDFARDEKGTTHPIYVPLAPAAVDMMEAFGRDMQERQAEAGGLLRSTLGKARGLALRLALVLAMLRWCGKDGFDPAPTEISPDDLGSACDLVADYLMPMAERVYGDAAATQAERNAATLARWIQKTKPERVHVRTLQREVRLPGLNTAALIHEAALVLIEGEWLRPIPPGRKFGNRPTAAYPVNPAIWEGQA